MESIKHKMYVSIRNMVKWLPYPILKCNFLLRSRDLKKREYRNSKSITVDNNYVVSVINEKMKSGGLSDRINGIISTFHAATQANREYRLIFTTPFDINLFLVPNEIKWNIEEDEIDWSKDTKVTVIRPLTRKLVGQQLKDLISLVRKNPNSQIHVYSNFWIRNAELFHNYFHQLFKPSIRLQKRIDDEMRKIGTDYISVTYRFQQLLGDFIEGDYKKLNDSDKETLIQKSIKQLIDVHHTHPNMRLLVTSDSKTFLSRITHFDYTYVIEGELVHMDYNSSADFETHVKSFLDLFMIANAKIIYSVATPPLYNSGFPIFAAQINNRPIKIIQ